MKRCFCDFCNKEVETTCSGDTNTITLHVGGTHPGHDETYDICNSCVLRIVDMIEDSDDRTFTTRLIKALIERNR